VYVFVLHRLHDLHKKVVIKMEKIESYEWENIDGKKLRVKFRRIIDENGKSWMEMVDAFTVEEIK